MIKTFTPSSELTFDTVSKHRKHLLKCAQNSTITHLNINLHQVKVCDSAGLALLIEAKRLCTQYNKDLVLENMPNEIAALAEFCGVHGLLN